MPRSWRIAAAVVGVVVLIAAWNVFAHYRERHLVEELAQKAAQEAAQNAHQAELRAQQKHAKLAEKLRQHRATLYNNYQQFSDQARQIRAAEAARLEARRQHKLQIEASYMLGANQQCVNGIVIERHGSSYSRSVGSNGHRIACKGKKAAEPLR